MSFVKYYVSNDASQSLSATGGHWINSTGGTSSLYAALNDDEYWEADYLHTNEPTGNPTSSSLLFDISGSEIQTPTISKIVLCTYHAADVKLPFYWHPYVQISGSMQRHDFTDASWDTIRYNEWSWYVSETNPFTSQSWVPKDLETLQVGIVWDGQSPNQLFSYFVYIFADDKYNVAKINEVIPSNINTINQTSFLATKIYGEDVTSIVSNSVELSGIGANLIETSENGYFFWGYSDNWNQFLVEQEDAVDWYRYPIKMKDIYAENLNVIQVVQDVGVLLYNDGTLWCWGDNTYGGLGDNTTTTRSTPVAVCGNHTFCKVALAYKTVTAIDNHGKAWSWGHKLCGDNTVTTRCTPIAVCGNHTFCEIFPTCNSTFESGMVAIDNHGLAWAWGYNSNGALGDNTTTNRYTPVAVCGNHTFCKVVYNGKKTYNCIGLDNHGQAWGWGTNTYGVIGDGTTTNRSTPVAVCGNHTFCEINGGLACSGLDKNGLIWAWGYNANYIYGSGAITSACQPQSAVALWSGSVVKFHMRISSPNAFFFTVITSENEIWQWGQAASLRWDNYNPNVTSPGIAQNWIL